MFTEAMNDVTDAIMGAMPAFDGYEQKVEGSLSEVLTSQRLYLEDLRAWTDLQAQLVGQVSPEVFEFLEGMTTPEKGFIARMAAGDEDYFWNTWLPQVQSNFSQASTIIGQQLFNTLPITTRNALAAMIPAIRSAIEEETGLTGEALQEALEEKVSQALSGIGINDALTDLVMTDRNFRMSLFATLGQDLAGALMGGLTLGLLRQTPVFQHQFNEINERIKDQLGKDYEVSSPSKFTMRIGKDLAAGLHIGFDQNLQPLEVAPIVLPQQPLPEFTPAISVISQTQPQTQPTTITFDNTFNITSPIDSREVVRTIDRQLRNYRAEIV